MIWYLSSQPDLRSGLAQDFLLRKIAHMVVFGLLTLFVARAWQSSKFSMATFVAVCWSLTYAGVDEWHQSFVPGRHGTLHDVAIDAIGIGIMSALLWWQKIDRPALRRDDLH